MNLTDALILFGLFIIYLGLGLLIYLQLVGLLLRFHVLLFPRFAKLYARSLGIPKEDIKSIDWNEKP
ncbi:MAG: hypothetical protein LBD10_14120 [Desulfobulbus sp.]|jgi:hypothetical protein|uniref:hypothetical protein n=1 Tax=Desulfobulbus sp. TaxID=895 RepID=UPI00284B5F92|nr:hypothetical protein [Desulfobulbus sp.]MDR2551327.1 hypothetical protein [Desulfobulbus sp.]